MKEVCFLTRRIFATVLLISVVFFMGSCVTKPKMENENAPESKGLRIIDTVRIPNIMPRGLVSDKQTLWMIDTREKALKQIDPQKKQVVATIPIAIGEPRGVTWDGKTFWIVDNREKAVHQVDPEKGAILRTILVPINFDKEKTVLEAAAFDGKHLWVAYFAGWSSKILKIDIDTGEVLQEMFAKGHPRALATDGRRLWMLSYNQGVYTGVILERTIMDDSRRMNLSAKFIGRTSGKEPAGMAFDGRYLWIADSKMKAIQKVELP